MIFPNASCGRQGSADPAAKRAPVTRVEHNRAHGAPIRHHCNVASTQSADDGRIEFPITFTKTAKALGLSISKELPFRADKVIE